MTETRLPAHASSDTFDDVPSLNSADVCARISLEECKPRVSVGVALRVVLQLSRTAVQGDAPRGLSASHVVLGRDGSIVLVEGAAVDAAALAMLLEELLTPAFALPQRVRDLLELARSRDEALRAMSTFRNALVHACSANGLVECSAQEFGQWVVECASEAASSRLQVVPDLDLPAPSGAFVGRGVAPVSASAGSSSPSVVASVPVLPASTIRKVAPPQESDELGEFEMNIERNVVPTADDYTARPSGPQSVSRSNLALDRRSPILRPLAKVVKPARDVSELAERAIAHASVAAVFLVVMGALVRWAHRPGGRSIKALLPHAFDGTSMAESGTVALSALVFAAVFLYFGVRSRPHSWFLVASGAAWLLFALAMVTVALASNDESGMPPDGVLLVPYILPLAVFLFALALGARAVRLMEREPLVKRIGGIPLAAVAGVLAFVAFEMSRFAL